MKRIICSRNPDENPSDRAEGLLDDLDDVLKSLRRIYTQYRKFYDVHKIDDDEMLKLGDCIGNMVEVLREQRFQHKNDISRKNTLNYPKT